MKRTALWTTLFALIVAAVLGAADRKDNPEPAVPAAREALPAVKAQPVVEVAFVLDTTGSMSGLISAAKEKIWHIANQIVLGQPKPKVRIALVPYRDKGDEYVTKVFDLTDNLDQVYTDLMTFRADGGGDGPENVNQALHDAVHKLSWSQDRKTLRLIYLVGDYPPHNEYTDVPTYDKTAAAAVQKGIYINAVLCGGNTDTAKVWKEIADAAEGYFLTVEQSGGVTHIATPYDKELAKLNAELVSTAVAYGDRKERAAQEKLNDGAKKYDAPAAAESASYRVSAGEVASNDLVSDVQTGKVDVAKLEKDKLPENMQKMTAEERKQYVADQQQRREKVAAQIKDLSAKRNEHVRKQMEQTKGAKDGFDQQVPDSLKTQAAKVNVEYK
ncbi:MAG TPA: vWA domain-containing protein [Phycisphaerae bacterium]|nr:vWA domain-containing protein [Phycisphaerae bacterium]